MPKPTPVPGQILLSTDELVNLIDGLRNLIPDKQSREQVVRIIFSSVNNWRFGEAAGETRRSDNGSLAVRVQGADGALGWDVVRLEDGDEYTADAIAKWQSIHSASWYYRIAECDYA